MSPSFRVAACHVSPILLNAADTTAKCISLINEAADNKAHLVVFPETYIPAFPYWTPVISPSEGHEFFIKMAKESVYVDGDEIKAVCVAAKERKIYVSLGISEKVRYSSATLFNANIIVSPEGKIVVHHRKLVPTFMEKLIWSMGDGHGLKVIGCQPLNSDQPIARVGALICGENTNPLARYTLIAQGEQFHISTWPAKAPAVLPPQSEDSKGPHKPVLGVYDNIALNRQRCISQCVEGKCFGLLCASFMSQQMIDTLVSMAPESRKEIMKTVMEQSAQAETLFIGPSGHPIQGFTVDKQTGQLHGAEVLRYQEGILYADLDMDDTIEGKQYHDVVGSYQRLDIFDLKVNTTRRVPIHLGEDTP
ncbi:hypothetical protein CLAIMM_11960 [Cladophialophora immunda]|nr:hypothetical protein CLAIMM_11960 [Cladophialophora immunda]